MTSPKKPREWWLDLDADWMCSETYIVDGPKDDGREYVHVVEYSALEQANKEIERLNNLILVSESATGVMHQATKIKDLKAEIARRDELIDQVFRALCEIDGEQQAFGLIAEFRKEKK